MQSLIQLRDSGWKAQCGTAAGTSRVASLFRRGEHTLGGIVQAEANVGQRLPCHSRNETNILHVPRLMR